MKAKSMRVIIPTEKLRTELIPNERASWSKISKFALSFDPKEETHYRSFVADISNAGEQSTVIELRSYLYNEQRRWNHFGREPDPETMRKIKTILLLIIEKLS